jgi:hypothetical protein
MRNFLVTLVVFSMLVMLAMAKEDDSWLWTAGKIVGGAAVGFVAAPVALGAIGFT